MFPIFNFIYLFDWKKNIWKLGKEIMTITIDFLCCSMKPRSLKTNSIDTLEEVITRKKTREKYTMRGLDKE